MQKVLARAGLGSRRSCEDLIAAGRVRVNERVAELGTRVVPTRDRVEIDGVEVPLDTDLVYYALHKPAGVVTTARDPQRRRTAVQLVPDDPRVFPIGRLDQDSSGLLLLTNDGEFANRVMHPRHGVKKTYLAEVRGRAGANHMNRLRKGVALDGRPVRVDRARVAGTKPGRSLVELVVHEGRNRMVRRVLDAVGLPVEHLVRTAIGPLELARLAPGEWRPLTRREVMDLLGAAETAPRDH